MTALTVAESFTAMVEDGRRLHAEDVRERSEFSVFGDLAKLPWPRESRFVERDEVQRRVGCSPMAAAVIMRPLQHLQFPGGQKRLRGDVFDAWLEAMRTLRPLKAADKRDRDLCYFIGSLDAVKIGHSRELEKRLAAIRSSNPHEIKVLALFNGGTVTEAYFHGRFRELHITGEWFRLEEPILARLREAA